MPPALANTLDISPHEEDSLTDIVDDLRHVLQTRIGADSPLSSLCQKLFYLAAETDEKLAHQRSRIDYLEGLSVTDELTGLYNRRGFITVLDKVLADARRHNEYGMLAFLDLDKFKHVNDTYGHEAGDFVLRHVADTLVANTRSTDYIARLGGDEFVILYCRADQMPTRARALKQCEMLNLSAVHYRGNVIPVEASMGLEMYGPHSTVTELMRGADAAMYRDKLFRGSQLTPTSH